MIDFHILGWIVSYAVGIVVTALGIYYIGKPKEGFWESLIVGLLWPAVVLFLFVATFVAIISNSWK